MYIYIYMCYESLLAEHMMNKIAAFRVTVGIGNCVSGFIYLVLKVFADTARNHEYF